MTKFLKGLWWFIKPLRAILLGAFLGLSGIGVYYGIREQFNANDQSDVNEMFTYPYYFLSPLLIISSAYLHVMTYLIFKPFYATFSNQSFVEVFFPKGEVSRNIPYPYLHAFIQGVAVLSSPLMSFFCLMMLGSLATTLGAVAPFGFPLLENAGYLLLSLTQPEYILGGIGGGLAGMVAVVTAFTVVTVISGIAAWFFPREQILPPLEENNIPAAVPPSPPHRMPRKRFSFLDIPSGDGAAPATTESETGKNKSLITSKL